MSRTIDVFDYLPQTGYDEEEERTKVWPPEDVWLINPAKDKFETPVDDRGFVDAGTLIQAIKDTVDPEYAWPRGRNMHHLYWSEDHFRSRFVGPDGGRFRELAVHKVVIPRVFHNWLHLVTIPPDVPDPELMRRRIESWAVAADLFESSRKIVQWNRRATRRAQLVQAHPELLPAEFNGEDVIGQEVMAEIISRHLSGVEMHRERLDRIPEEDRFVEPDMGVHEIAHRLGSILVPGAMKLTAAVAA